MIRKCYEASCRKKALNNQGLITEDNSAATDLSSKHTTNGACLSDVDIRTLLNLRQSSASSGNTRTIIGGTVMYSLLDTFLNASPASQAATIVFVMVLVWGAKRE